MSVFTNFSVNVDELPDFKSVELQPIQPKYKIILWLRFALAFVFFWSLPLLAYHFVVDTPIWAIYLAIGLLFVVFKLWGIEIYLGFPRKKFGVRELDIIFQRGFFVFKETIVPFKRIQHVETKQSFILRLFNLYALKLYTAGAATGDLVITGLDKSTAQRLKEKVLKGSSEINTNDEH
ncbi:MAG: PH domain-containing protein [Bacteroidota bacterium]